MGYIIIHGNIFNGRIGGGGAGTALMIAGTTLDILNRYIDITFLPGVYHAPISGPLLAADLQLIFAQNGGVATNCTISTITDTAGGALAGGETVVRVNLSFTGNPSGVETITIKPAADSSYQDVTGVKCSANDTTGAVAVYLELDAMYKAGVLLALNNSISPPGLSQRLVDNTLFAGWRSDGVLLEWDGLHLFTHTSDWGKINFVTGTVLGAYIGTITITPFTGGIASAASAFDTNWDPLTNAVKFLQNDASAVVCVGNNAQGISMFGGRGSGAGVNFGCVRLQPRLNTDQACGSLNRNSSANSILVTNADSEGVWMVSRESSVLHRLYLNATQLGTSSAASSTLTDNDFYVWAENVGGVTTSVSTTHQGMMAAWGSGQQDKVSEINSRLQTWKTDTRAMIPTFSGKLYALIGQSNADGGNHLISELTAPQAAIYNNGPLSMANGYDANCYVWWDDEWQFINPGVNGCVNGANRFTPLYPLAVAEAIKYPGEDLFFIAAGESSSGLYLIDHTTPYWIAGGAAGSPWVKFKNKYDNAIDAMLSTTHQAVIWIQGENEASTGWDVGAAAYQTDEVAFHAQVLANTGFTNPDFFTVQIHTNLLASNFPNKATVRAAKVTNAAGIPYTLVNGDAYGFSTPHWTCTGQIDLMAAVSAVLP